MADIDPQLQNLAASIDNLTRSLGELNHVMPNTHRSMLRMGETEKDIDGLSKGLTMGAAAASKLTKGFYDSAAAMYEGQKGLKAMDKAVDGVADALMVLTGALALIGGPITLLAAGLTAAVAAGAKYVKAANEQSDKLYDAFQQMSRSGGAASDGLQGLYNDVQKLGGGIQDLGDFVGLIASSSGDLATFAGSVYQGRKEFAKLGKEMEPFRASLMNAGMTQKEINESSMGYLRLQSRIGATQNKTTAQLAESTRKYLIEQDALTKLTGMTRKEQEDAREAIRSQEVFAGKLLQLRNKGADGAAKQLEDTFLVLQKDSKEVGQGFADISSGNLRTEAAQKLMRATQGEAMRVQEELSAGQITAAQAADRIGQALKRNVDMYGETQGVLGNYNATYGDLAGQITIASRQLTGGYEKQMAAINKNSKEMGITGDKALDAEVQRQTDLRLTQQKAMQNMQDFVRMGVEPATEATAFFGRVIERITNLLPGSGKFAKEYEQEKKDKEDLLAKEKAVQEQSQKIMDAKAKLDAATDEKSKKAAETELTAAKESLKNAMEERKRLKEEIAGRKGKQEKLKKETTPTVAPTLGENGSMVGGAGGEGDAGAIMSAAGTAPKPPAGAASSSTKEKPAGGEAKSAGSGAAGTRSMAPPAAGAAAKEKQGPKTYDVSNITVEEAMKHSTFEANLKKAGPGPGGKQAAIMMTKRDIAIERAKASPAGPEETKPSDVLKFGGKSGSESNFNGLEPAIKDRVLAAAQEFNQLTGQQLQINSAKRDPQDQERIYQETVDAGRPGRSPTGMVVAKPGTSPHELGMAVDIQNYRDPNAVKSMNNQGLIQTVAGDPVHFSLPKMADGGITQGPSIAGEAGPEAVIPLKNGSVPVAMPKEFVDGMSKYSFVMEQITKGLGERNISASYTEEAEKIKAQAMASAGPNADAMLAAFRQMSEELRAQGEANRAVFESMLRAQETNNDISSKILQTSQ